MRVELAPAPRARSDPRRTDRLRLWIAALLLSVFAVAAWSFLLDQADRRILSSFAGRWLIGAKGAE